MYILLAIVLFGILIFVHELGHFMAAKLLGVRVNEFAICMGPAIWQKRVGETTYSLRCIPVGGYCAMEGEDEQSQDPRAFTSKAKWRQAIILVAGAFMNFVAGLLILVVLMSLGQSFATPVIASFYEGNQIEGEDGLQVGDEIYSIDGHRVYLYNDISMLLQRGGDLDYDLVVIRDGEKVTLDQFHMEPQTFLIDGQEQRLYGMTFSRVEKSLWQVLKNAWYTSIDFGRMVIWGLQDLVSGAVGLSDFSGPVGIVSAISETGKASDTVSHGVQNVFYIGAFLAINLAYMNMLPIPALDGGRVFFLIVTAVIEKLSRRKLNPKYEGYIHAVGMVALLGFMVVVTFSDIFKLVMG